MVVLTALEIIPLHTYLAHCQNSRESREVRTMKSGNHKHKKHLHSSIYWVIIQPQLMFKHAHNRYSAMPRVYSDSTTLPMRPCAANMPTDCADRGSNDMSALTYHRSHNYTPATWILLNIMAYYFPSWNTIFGHLNINVKRLPKNPKSFILL